MIEDEAFVCENPCMKDIRSGSIPRFSEENHFLLQMVNTNGKHSLGEHP